MNRHASSLAPALAPTNLSYLKTNKNRHTHSLVKQKQPHAGAHTHTRSIHSFSHAREEGREKAVEFINGGEEVEKEGEALDLSTKTHKPLVTHNRVDVGAEPIDHNDRVEKAQGRDVL